EDFIPDLGKSSQKIKSLEKLLKLQGLDEIKESIIDLVGLLQNNEAREEMGLPTVRPSLNLVFKGNPGTGKTLIAKIYGEVLHELGYLSDGNVIRVTASDLMGSALGQAEDNIRRLFEENRGTVIFIDEAYQLNDDLYGRSAVDTLVAHIRAEADQDVAVILA